MSFVWKCGHGVKVLAETEDGLIALDKPEGVLSHPNRASERGRSLITDNFDHGGECFVSEGGEKLWLLHRLDSPTSGILLCCKDEAIASQIKGMFSRAGVQKTYLALCFGQPKQKGGEWKDKLAEQRAGQSLRVGVSASGKLCQTSFKVLCARKTPLPISLIELRPITGFTHQLRVQAASRQLPIVGDANYGDFHFNREAKKIIGSPRLFLHASRVELSYRSGSSTRRFAAISETPQLFSEAMGGS